MKVVYSFITVLFIFLLIIGDTVYSAGSSGALRLYTIQVAHITDPEEAKRRAEQISHLIFLPVRIKKTIQDYFVILAGEAERYSDLSEYEDILRKKGYIQASIVNDSYGAIPAVMEIVPAQTDARLATVKKKPAKAKGFTSFYMIQVAHITSRVEAKKRAKHLFHITRLRTRIKEKDQYYILLAGGAERRSDLLDDMRIIRKNGYPQAVIINNHRLEPPETLEVFSSIEVAKEKQSNLLSLVRKTHYGADDYTMLETDVMPHLMERTETTEEAGNGEKNDDISQAWTYYREKQFDNALELCDRVLFFDPFDMDVLYLKLNILVQTRQFMEARMILANVSGERNSLKLLQLRADLECWLENYDGAIVLYQDLIRKWPENGDIWFGYLKALSSAQEWSLLSKAIKEGIDKIEMSDERLDFMVEMYLSLEETEKALCIWKGMDTASNHWGRILFAIVNKLTAGKKPEIAVQVLEQALSMDETNAQVAGALSLKYASMDMPEKGMEVLRQFKKAPETGNTMNVAKAQLFSLINNYEIALSLLQTVEHGDDNNYKAQLIELECYYGLEDYETLIAKSSSLLQKCGEDTSFPKSRVLALRILALIKAGLQAEAEREIGLLFATEENKYTAAMLSVLLYAYDGIELLSAMENSDYGSAVFSLSLFASSGQLEEHYKSIQVLGKALKEPSDTPHPQFFEEELASDRSKVIALRMLHAWKIADELSGHTNEDIKAQLAMAEYRAGNFQRALELYEQLYSIRKEAAYKLGMMECFLAMNNKKKALEVCDEIQLSGLPRQEVSRYLENMVKLEIEREAFYTIISGLPEDLTGNTRITAAIVIANIQYGDYFLANKTLTEYLLNKQSSISLFQLIMDMIGDFDKGMKGKYYQFVKNWLNFAVDLYPENMSLPYQYAQLLAMHGEDELAQKQFLAMWESNFNDTRVMRWMGRLNSRAQQFETSLKWYDLYVKIRPSDIIVRRERDHVHHWVVCKKQSDMIYAIVSQCMPGDYNRYWEWQAKRSDLNAKQQSVFLQDTFATHYQKRRHPLAQLKQIAFYDGSGSGRKTINQELSEDNPGDGGYSFDQNAGKWKRNQSFHFMTLNESFEEKLKNYGEERILQYPGDDGKGEKFEIIGNSRMNDTFNLLLRCDKEGILNGFYAAPSYELKNISTKRGRTFLGSMLCEG